MFNLIPDAAKLALVVLQRHLQQVAAGWIDCQLPNPFLMQQGAQPMAREQYVILLEQHGSLNISPEHWQPRTLTYALNHD